MSASFDRSPIKIKRNQSNCGLTDAGFETLLSRLERAPDNVTGRLAVIRRAVDLNLDDRALHLAFDLVVESVENADDRQLIRGVFSKASLAVDAAIWGAAEAVLPSAEAATAAADPVYEAPEPAVELDALPADPEADTGATNATDKVVHLRAVTSPGTNEDQLDAMTFKAVGRLNDVKREFERRIIAPFKQSSLLSRFKKKSGDGVWMYGPPGCGKTMVARAAAGGCGARFQPGATSDILDPLWGVAEQRLSAIFEKARNSAPTILFFDEIDALGAKRPGNVASHVSQMVSHFLAEMGGVKQRNDGVLILAATNIPWSMDPASLRPVRFDRLFFVPPPDAAAQKAILNLEIAGRPAEANIDFKVITTATSGYSGADLALAANPNLPIYQLVRAMSDAILDDEASAQTSLNEALRRDPENVMA
ncbi:MAG: ATP-binding protein [Pseudomonadota bacterium]